MISAAQEAKIFRLYFDERWAVGTIATQLHIHHDVVDRVVINPLCQHSVRHQGRL